MLEQAVTQNSERRYGTRFLISLPIRVEWDDESGSHVVEDGTTENIGPEGTLVHLPRALPNVGTSVQLAVFEEKGAEVVRVEARVLRVERNAAHPLAALRMFDSVESWRENVWSNQPLIKAFSDSSEEYDD
ncbi:MAG: PilZ domain-containing protein [Pyrinomonadaceae bacterium]|nr:PilZ domain-containing protein [Pyrinomonadaceae bacterium]